MRSLMTEAQVTLSDDGCTPALVSWGSPLPYPTRRTARVVGVLDEWRYDGRWWEERELHRIYYLLELSGGARLELFNEEGAWWAARLSD